MIRYEQLEQETDGKRDVKVITDNAKREMAALEESFTEADADEMHTFENIGATKRNTDGLFEFIIPGPEVGEMADIFWDVDNGLLESEMDRWNEQALKAREQQDS